MFVKIGRKEFKVVFYHMQKNHYTKVTGILDDKRVTIKKLNSKKSRLTTYCEIRLGDKTLSIGKAILNPIDKYNRKAGKAVALKKALMNLPGHTQLYFWEEFHKQFPK
jgi:hypothetical protein